MIPTPYMWINRIVIICVAFASGVAYEHGNLLEYKDKVEGAAQAQNASVKAVDAKNDKEANDYAKQLDQATKSIADYYKSHPVVRVQYDSTCQLSKATSDSQGSNGTPEGWYVSPYSPADTEAVAARLNELQKLLLDDGVTVK